MKKSILLILLMALLAPWTGLQADESYCTPAPTSIDGSGISAISLGGVTQTSATHPSSAPYYADNSALSFSVPAGGTANVAVTYRTGYTYGTVIWVDWNNDFTFADDEVVYKGTSTNSNPTTLTCSFSVPLSQEEGTYRMRIGGADSQFDNFISGTSATANACGNTTYTIYEDYSITVTAPLACPYIVSDLEISELHTNSATIIYVEATDEAGAFEAELSTDSNFPEGSTTFYSAESEAFGLGDITFEGLIPAAKYYVRMRAYCEDELSSGEWSSTFSFTTKCEAVSAINENFEGITAGSGVLPTCWTRINKATSASYADYPYVYYSSAEALTGNNSLRFYTNNSSSYADEYAVLPEMDNLSGKRIIFYAKQNYSATLQVGTIDDPTKDDFIFTPLGENIVLTSAYKKFIVNLESDDKFIAFKLAKPNSGYNYITVHIDSIIVEDIPSCLGISDLAFVSATTNSATLNWSASESGESAWDIYYSTENVAPTAETVPQVVAATAKAIPNGLNASSTYYVWVRAHCLEDHGAWSDPISFKTECEAISAFPYSENFDSYIGSSSESAPSSYPNDELPQCWSFLNRASSNSTYPQAFISSKSGYVVSGNCLFFKSSSTTPLYAILPQFAEEISALKLLFTYRNEGITDYNGTLYAGYMTNPADASTFVPVLTCDRTTALTEKEVLFGGAPAGSYIAFKYEGGTNNNYYLSIDNVSVLLAPTCTKPASISEPSDITSSSASFSWTAGDANTPDYEYVIVAKDSTPDWSLAVEVNGATSVVVNEGLAANTAYDFYVRGNCGDAALQKSDALHVSFRTGCAPYEAASFTEDFEDGIYCWTVGNLQSEDGVSHVPYAYSSAKYKGEYGLYMIAYKSYSTVHDSAYAVLPQMNYGEKSLKDYSISFYAKASSSSDNTHLILGVVADPADSLASFEQIADLELTTSFDLYEYSFANYEGSKPYIVLLATLPDGYASSTSKTGEFYIDDIALFETPSCQPLRSISISDLARRSMVVNLEPKAGIALASEYELVISKTELDDEALEAADKIAINDTNAYEISGLDRETLYYIYVRANCGGESKSAWVSTSAKTKALSYVDELIVADGSATSSYLPINTSWTDTEGTHMQSIYPADMLTDLIGKEITSLHYFASGTNSSWTDAVFEVRMMQTETATMGSSFVATTGATLVYTGTVTVNPTDGMLITLATPFTYTEGNLLIDFLVVTSDYYNSFNYYGVSTTNDQSRSRSTNYKFLPKVAFGYNVALEACPAVSELNAAVLGTGTTKEKISWAISGADYLSGFDMIVSEAELDDEALAAAEITYPNIQGLSKDLENLTPSTDYYVYLRAICQAEGHDEGNSDWASVHFKTLADCPAVINLSLELGATDSITATWERATMEQAKEFKYILTKTRLDVENITAELSDVNDTVIAFSELDHAQKYYFYVASACGDATSAFVEDSIETLPACQAVENLAASRVEHNRVELAWTSAQLATETEWKVGIVGDPIPAQTVSERNALLFGLSAETAYEAYVIALCGEESVSDSAKVAFNTAAQPGNCAQVGEGTSTEYGPVCAFYGYERNGYIFTAEEGLTSSGKILSLGWTGNSAATIPAKIYMKNTTETAFETSKSWNDLIADATLVLDASVVTANGTYEVDIEDFDFTGDNLMILVASNYGGSGGATINSKYFNASGSAAHIFARKDGSIDDDAAISSFSSKGTNNHLPNTQFCFEAKAAPDVTALAISDITTNSAKASWEPMGSEIAWNVFISPTQVTDFSGVVAERVETLSKSFTGLNDDEDYFVYVQPAVEGAEYSMVSFRTVASCLIQTNPAVVTESITAHTARVTWVDPNAVKAGNYKVVYAKADEFDLEDADFAYVNATDTFADLSELQADTVYKFAVMANCSDEDNSRYSAVASFATLKSCFTPYATTVIDSTITAYSATVYWKDDHDDAGYLVAYGLYDSFDLDNPETYLTKNVTDTFAVLEGLTAGESYKVSIKGDCSSVGEGQSKTWAPYAYFNTKCEAKALPYSEDFESASSLVCWTVGNIQEERDSYGSYLSYDPGRASSAKANGEYGLKIHAYKSTGTYGTDADSAYAVLPELVFGEDAITDYQIRFNAKANIGSGYYSNYYSHLLIGVAEDDALTNLAIIADTAISTSAFQEVELSFAAYAGTGNRIVLLARVDPSSTATYREAEIYVDDIHVSKLPACKRPASIEVSAITESSASFAWTAGGEETNFEYIIVAAGETPDWSLATAVNGAAEVNVNEGLVASTAYNFYVRANCGEGEENKSEARAISFRTACGAVVVDAENSFEEGFEDTDFAPACWENIASGTYNWKRNTSSSYVHSGDASASSGYYGDIYLALPPLAIADEEGRVELSFYSYNSFTSDYDKNSVVLLGETEQELWTPGSVVASWEKDSIDLSAFKGQTITLAFKYKGSNAHGWYIDDVKVEFVSEGGIGTGIDAIGTESEKAVKFVKDDHIYILRNGILYDVTGRLIRK